MNKKEKDIEKRLNAIIDERIDKRIDITCQESYYKNQYLKYAIENHTSPQCIGRTYIELLKAGYEYTKDPQDLKHMNICLQRLTMVHDKEAIDYLGQTLDQLREKTYEEFDYVILDAPGRIKSFKSSEAKNRTKLATEAVLKELLLNKNGELSEFSEEEIPTVTELLKKKLEDTSKSAGSDTFGLRCIVYSFERKTDEKHLTDFVFKYSEFVQKFLYENGFEILEVKDYVTHPKDNNYQSIHIKTVIAGISFEIQIRTIGMHDHAEDGGASHDKYKNTKIQKFMQSYLYKISGPRAAVNEKIGILKEQPLHPTIWCFATKEKIPKTPAQVEDFKDKDFLAKVFSK